LQIEISGKYYMPFNPLLDSKLRVYTQVYTAEEKAALAMYNFEENKKKEQKILADMQTLVQRTLGEDAEDDTDVPKAG
jgi:hypothetical protein